ncbi:hypothetical protein [Kineosporia babensis]|uniref:Uncharacterized protein n=1 Tax=Kineosporia babensis TaxID=499548 RepID=A0A9X1ND99_9ACTN|nr:hypothetical protein [Kineosporia babensis]MCD5310923.1 hypothetical protein [Kineosporia babensis]
MSARIAEDGGEQYIVEFGVQVEGLKGTRNVQGDQHLAEMIAEDWRKVGESPIVVIRRIHVTDWEKVNDA